MSKQQTHIADCEVCKALIAKGLDEEQVYQYHIGEIDYQEFRKDEWEIIFQTFREIDD